MKRTVAGAGAAAMNPRNKAPLTNCSARVKPAARRVAPGRVAAESAREKRGEETRESERNQEDEQREKNGEETSQTRYRRFPSVWRMTMIWWTVCSGWRENRERREWGAVALPLAPHGHLVVLVNVEKGETLSTWIMSR